MSTRARPLSDLGHQLAGCADDTLLDAPLDALRVDDDDVRELLRGVCEAGDARTLRELCGGDALDAWAREIATPSEERSMRAQLERWLGTGAIGEDDPARLAALPPLPRDLEGILAWARPVGLLGELTRPACEVVRDDEGALSPRTSLVECCLGQQGELAPGSSLLARHRLEADARAYLVREAAAHASLGARATLWARVLPDGALRRLAERLRALVAGADVATLAAVTFVPARRVSIDGERGVARGMITGGSAGPFVARLLLSGHEHRAIESACDRCARGGCLHVRALAARLLDACLDPGDRLRGALVELAEVPSWQRFVRALAPDGGDDAARTERLVFRVELEREGRATVAIALEKKQPSGRWSQGRLVSAGDAVRSRACAERDRPVLDAIASATRQRSAQPVLADLAILRGLVEHPRVALVGGGSLRLREEIVHLELLEQPDGVVPRVTLAGAVVAPGARPRDPSLLHHDRAGSTLVFAPLTEPLRRLLAALETFRGVLPRESWPALAPWLASMKQVARVSAPSAMRGTERPAPHRLLLRVTPGRDTGIDVALSVRALAMAPLWSPAHGPELVHGLEDGAQVFARRDLDRERATAERVIAALGLARHVSLEPFAWRVEAEQDALAVLAEAARCADVLEIEWAERAARLTIGGTIRASDLSIDVRRRGAWLALGGGARVSDVDVAIGRLIDAARRNERFVVIAGGDHAEIERELFERLRRAQLCVGESTREPAMSIAALRYWTEMLGAPPRAVDEPTRAWLERARAGEPVELDAHWTARLRSYQREGVEWLLDRARWSPGACLADEMGLGKTVQTIALLEARAALGPALVVAPTSVVSSWVAELARFAPALEVRAHRGGARGRAATAGQGVVIVTSYDVLLRDRERFAELAFATLIADEAQAIKNARTQRARAVASIDAAFRVALSGTPVENRLADLWSLFQLIAPGLLGSWPRFRARFAVPIERHEDAERAALLRSMIAPFVLRRTKREVARELPARTEVVHRVELSPAEQDLYAAAVRQARRAMRRSDATGPRSVRLLAELTRLRQLACHPRLVVEDARIESSKLHALVQLLGDVLPRGHRALVFSQFTRHLDLVREALDARGVASLTLDGSTPVLERARRVERFQRGDPAVFLISLKAGGTGLNLTAADYVIHLDPWWNPSTEDQASDRAHRIGQERPVTIVKLVAQGTIEETVLAMHEHKRRLAESVLAGAATPALLDEETLEALLAAR